MPGKLIDTLEINGVEVIYDGYTEKKRSRPLVVCPKCHSKRRVLPSYIGALKNGEVSGRCSKCGGELISEAKKGVLRMNQDETLETGSIIHWSERDPEKPKQAMVTCGICKEKRLTTIPGDWRTWSGYCLPCATGEGQDHGHWKGGRCVDNDGYILVHISMLSEEERELTKSMITQKTYVREHRLVMAVKLGRPLKRGEVVHHLNGLKQDNRPENLKLTNAKEHPRENATVFEQFRAEIARLQRILDEHGISY
jgi:hypothetical protein